MSDVISVGLWQAGEYLKWLAADDPGFECHVVARRENGEVRIYFGDANSFRVHQWDHLDDAAAERALADWISAQVAALDIDARPVD